MANQKGAVPIDKPAFSDALVWMCFNRRVGMVIENNDPRGQTKSSSGAKVKDGRLDAGKTAAKVAALNNQHPPSSRGNVAVGLEKASGKSILQKLKKERADAVGRGETALRMNAGEAAERMALLRGAAWADKEAAPAGPEDAEGHRASQDAIVGPKLPLKKLKTQEAQMLVPKVVFVYGSQTGTGQDLARNLHAEAVQRGISADVKSWNELGFSELGKNRTPILIVIQSSTGDGETPDNSAHVFAEFEKQLPMTLLNGVQFTMLGLGDSSYTTYMGASRWLKRRLQEVGAAIFYPDCEADDAEGIEVKADPWAEGLWEPLTELYMGLAGSQMVPGGVDAASGSPMKKPQVKGIRAVEEAQGLIQSTRLVMGPDGVMTAVSGEAGTPGTPGSDSVLAQIRAKGAKGGSARPCGSGAPLPTILIAYGSQTGTAEGVAYKLYSQARQLGVKAEVKALDDVGLSGLSKDKTPIVVIITSSTGSGKAPDNASEMIAALREAESEELLKGVNFTLLGLGDSSYYTFMAAPRLLHSRFVELGAHLFYPFVEADEQKGQAGKVKVWCDGLWGPLEKKLVGVVNEASTRDSARSMGRNPFTSAAGHSSLMSASELDIRAATLGPAGIYASASELEDADAAAGGMNSLSEISASEVEAAAADLEGENALATSASQDRSSLARIDEASELTSAFDEGSAAKGIAKAGKGEGEVSGNGSRASPRNSLDRSTSTSSRASASGKGKVPGSGAKSSRMGREDSVSGGPPETPGSVSARETGTPRGHRSSMDKVPGRLTSKPTSVNFPKREDTVVKEKPESELGLQLGLAPVGADMKGALAPIPCRVKVATEKDAKMIAAVKKKEAARPSAAALQYRDPQGMYSMEQPFWAQVSDARYETAFWSDRKVLHVELDVKDSGMKYEPGDSIGVMPSNPPEMVNNLLKRLKRNADDVINIKSADGSSVLAHIPAPCTLGHVLTYCVDLTSATKKSVLRMLAEHCHDPCEKRTLIYFTSKGGKEAYAHEIAEHQPNLLDLLLRFKTCSPPWDALLDALPAMTPRFYSVTSSPSKSPNKVQVAMSVVRFKTKYGNRLGVATTWLDRLAQPYSNDRVAPPNPIKIPVFLKRNQDFKLPADLSTPIIMVGPGTGVAPFRAFLQTRQEAIKKSYPDGLPKELPEGVGASWLFFGCRREDEDYIYGNDLSAFAADNTLTELKVAFSRAQANKVYVQDMIKENGAAVAELINNGAVVYVCGDGSSMAKDVHATLQALIAVHNNISEEEAASKLVEMAQQRRYIKEVWS